jgi:hypothetical protein
MARHRFNGEAVLRGAGAPAVKSAALLSVSVQPPASRKAAVVLLKVGAAPAAFEEIGIAVANQIFNPRVGRHRKVS